MSTAGNDDTSPLINLISCIVCNETMKVEKSSPDTEGGEVINIGAACATELSGYVYSR